MTEPITFTTEEPQPAVKRKFLVMLGEANDAGAVIRSTVATPQQLALAGYLPASEVERMADDKALRSIAFHKNQADSLRARLAEAEAERDKAREHVAWFVNKAADEKLDGYRELGQRAADAENERDEMHRALRAETDALAQAREELAALRASMQGVTDINELVKERDAALAQVKGVCELCYRLQREMPDNGRHITFTLLNFLSKLSALPAKGEAPPSCCHAECENGLCLLGDGTHFCACGRMDRTLPQSATVQPAPSPPGDSFRVAVAKVADSLGVDEADERIVERAMHAVQSGREERPLTRREPNPPAAPSGCPLPWRVGLPPAFPAFFIIYDAEDKQVGNCFGGKEAAFIVSRANGADTRGEGA